MSLPYAVDPEKVEEHFRDKLVDWMISLDIPTGGSAQSFDELLEVIGNYIVELKRKLSNVEE